MNTNASGQKNTLRNRMLERRKNIGAETYTDASARITERLKRQQEFRDAETVHCYVSLNDRGEVDTHPLIRELLESGKQVVVPVTDFETHELRHVFLDSYDELIPNKWGVPEPADGERVDTAELDLVIVPMVAGDAEGNRLGYGKGFYDRFLSDTNCPAIGLCFEECIVEAIPVEPFDIAMDKIVTQERVVDG